MQQTSLSRQRNKTKDITHPTLSTNAELVPRLSVRKVGIVSRDLNGLRDFSATFSRVLGMLDCERCDTVLFSPWSIVPRKSFNPLRSLRRLKHVKSVFYEEFVFVKKPQGKRKRHGIRAVVLNRRGNKWRKYELPGGGFSNLRGSWQAKKCLVAGYIRHVLPGRILGNCCVMICGETNGVAYHPDRGKKGKVGKVGDDFGLRRSLPKEVTVILNPVHDWMSRFQMPLKRKFLSRDRRWVISVWNKGKRGKNNKPRDAKGDPWTVFRNGREVEQRAVQRIQNEMQVDIGILKLPRA